jgi:hypothetical protein
MKKKRAGSVRISTYRQPPIEFSDVNVEDQVLK